MESAYVSFKSFYFYSQKKKSELMKGERDEDVVLKLITV
jgi:hypothetical protein